jgi:hypothetical protein
MAMMTVKDIASECSAILGETITIKNVQYASESVPERGRVGIVRVWDERDVPAFISLLEKSSGRRMKYRTTTAGWKATETVDAPAATRP